MQQPRARLPEDRHPRGDRLCLSSRTPLDFHQDGVDFTGKAGAVRVFKDRVALCLNSGDGEVGYQGHILTGHAPFEATTALNDLQPLTKDMGGYEKKIVTVDLGRGITVRGELPFTARLDGDSVKIHSEGRARQFILTWPEWLTHPQYLLDGQEWQVFVSDPASQGIGLRSHRRDVPLHPRRRARAGMARVWVQSW